jgi:hypothetical protein
MNTTCTQCGMPLGYESVVKGTVEPGPLCNHCATRSGGPAPSKPASAPWLLDWIFSVYRSESRFPGRIANALARLCPRKTTVESALLTIGSVPLRPADSDYDVLVLYSGGKDSSYMLLDLARRNVRVCAWMLNQGYQSPAAIENAKKLCDRLNVPLVVDRPDKGDMDSLFRVGFDIKPGDEPELVRAAMTYGSACWPCFATIAARASVFCHDHHIPLCFIGTQTGQNRLDLHGEAVLAGKGLPSMAELVERFVSQFRGHVESHALPATRVLLNKAPSTVIVPFFEFVEKPPVQKQIEILRSAGWKQPNNTGACSTNCMVNELGRHVMRQRFGFDLYQVIDANERRLAGGQDVRGVVPDVDLLSVVRAARMMKLSDQERAKYAIPELGDSYEEHR